MTLRRVSPLLLVGAVALTGCMPKMTVEKMKEMAPKQKPSELDRLNVLVGKWEGDATSKVMGMEEKITGKGTSQIHWEGDGWILVERGEYEMKDVGKMKGIGIWSWDSRAKRYRTTWTDSWGGTGVGTVRFDEKTNTYHMKVKGRNPHGSTRGKGTMKLADNNNTMQWTFQEHPWWDFFGLMKVFEMEGTSKKKS